MAADRPDGRARQAGGAGHPDQEDELLPDRLLDPVAYLGVDAAVRAGVTELPHARRQRAVVLAEHQLRERAGMTDDSRLGDGSGDVTCAADDVLGAQSLTKDLVLPHAVLERHHRGVSAEQRLDGVGCLHRVPQLHGEQHEVDGADPGGLVGDLNIRQLHVAERAVHAQSVGAQHFKLSPAGHERHLVTALRQPGTEVAAQRTGGHHSNPHNFLP